MASRTIGKIDERGYLNGFQRRGFTFTRCLLELEANILDAMDGILNTPSSFVSRALMKITTDDIRIIDNGVGMNEKAAEDMFSLHRENNAHRQSRGVSGIGAKAALCNLSNKTTVHLYTRKLGGHFLHITVPWEEIFARGQYTGMVRIEQMTEEEKLAFQAERSDNGMLFGAEAQGTTIKFQPNDSLANVIRENFKKIRESDITNPLDRIDFVFGTSTTQFLLSDSDNQMKTLDLYNYFAGSEANFYTGRARDTIHQYRKGDEDRFIWDISEQEQYEITKNGAGLSKEPKPCTQNTVGWRHVGSYEVTTGMRVDLEVFNPSTPKTFTAERKIDSYNMLFLGDSDEKLSKLSEEYLFYYKLLRNGQRITVICPELVKVGNARANGESRLKIENIQCEVNFNPISSQDNAQDHAMGIQENKNQLDSTAIPKKFTRLLEAIKAKKADQIWRYMEGLCAARRPPPVPLPVISDSESEEESESEDEQQQQQQQQQQQGQANGGAGSASSTDTTLNRWLGPLPQPPSQNTKVITGEMMMTELVRVMNLVNDTDVYPGPIAIQLYNLLSVFQG